MDLTDSLRDARLKRGLSQRELARAAGVPQSTEGRIETGALHPRTDTVEKLLRALDQEIVLRGRLGLGVDRTLIRQMLALPPRERLLYAVSGGEAIKRLRHGVRVAE